MTPIGTLTRILATALPLLFLYTPAGAQEVKPVKTTTQPATETAAPDTLTASWADTAPEEELPLTTPMYNIASPALPDVFSGWRLHQGFNGQLGLSVTAGAGRHAPKGVGFGQTAVFAYVLPITPKLSLAAGLYARNTDWGGWRSTDAGIAGSIAYHPNDRVDLYLYGTKSFLPRDGRNAYGGFGEPWIDNFKDRIGAAAEFKIGENARIGVSLEYGHPNRPPFPHRRNAAGTNPFEDTVKP